MIGFRTKAVLLGLGALVPYAYLAASTKLTPKVSYTRDVAPIFKAHCISCHSGASSAAKLDLSSESGILKGGVGGKLVGNHSLLLARIDGSKPPQMPLGAAPLSEADQQIIRSWIQLGMSFESGAAAKHWAYVAPVPPKIPNLASNWVLNPIDAFILQKLKQNGLTPSPTASRSTLVRRLSLDLIGLPPTPAEVNAFVNDKSPDAYDKVVDRLLASPHYGERQAREWLDLARYADSDGYEKDLNRSSWLYRNWVIDAFNENKPYDQFTIEQIAGDLLPNSTPEQKIATGFQRNTMFNREGGVDQQEAHFLVQLDRAEVTSTVWLGSTLNCARCHDHKYDPFTQEDYYKMVAFYNNTAVFPRGPKSIGEEKWLEAEMRVPTKDQAAEISRLKADIQRLKTTAGVKADFEGWRRSAAVPVIWKRLKPLMVASAHGEKPVALSDGSVLVGGPVPSSDTLNVSLPALEQKANAIRLEVFPDSSLAGSGPGRSDNGNFVLTHLTIKSGGRTLAPGFAKADFSQPDYDPLISLAYGAKGWAVDGQEGKPHQMIVELAAPVPAGAPFSVELTCDSPYLKHIVGKFALSVSDHPAAAADLLTADERSTLINSEDGSKAEASLRAFWNERIAAPIKLQILQDQAALARIEQSTPTALVMQENPTDKPLAEWVRHRGEFGSKTKLVEAGTPGVLNPLPPGKRDRLALAKWLVSRQNPLTARVQVNRMWEMLFGRGLVETSEDFGTRGSRPTHPELLDYLACWFMNHNWDMKALYRLIVTSNTYRQSSDATPQLMAKDSENLLLARGARFRMEAEMIHDVALGASGLLSPKIGGPSVYPLQPDHIWDSPYNGESWTTSTGEDLYRRGIYTFWKRTAPFPSFVALDATSRESCTVRRIRTNTPLQALALLNDKLMMNAAQSLGKKMESGGTSLSDQISTGFELCTARRPKLPELNRLERLEKVLEERYSKTPTEASKLGRTARDAAFTMVGNVLLNLDETITKS